MLMHPVVISSVLLFVFAQDVRWFIPERSRHLYDSAVKEFRSGQQDKAFKLLDKIVVAEPNCIVLQHRAAELYAQKGDFRSAISCADTVIKINANSREAFFIRGYSNYQLGNFAKAIDDFDVHIKSGIATSEVYALRAHCKRNLGDFRKSIDDYRTAYKAKKDPNYLYLVAECMCEQSDYKSAKREFEMIAKSHPEFSRAYVGIGFTCLMSNDSANADAAFKVAIQKDPALQKNVDDIKSWVRLNKAGDR